MKTLNRACVLFVMGAGIVLAGCAALAPEPDVTATTPPFVESTPAATVDLVQESGFTATPLPVESVQPTLPAPTLPETGAPLLGVVFTGGLCASGAMCRYEVLLSGDGRYTTLREDGARDSGMIAVELVNRLREEMAGADYGAIMAVPFTGTCPTAYDGQEVIYTFHLPGGPLTISSCEFAIDVSLPLFQAVEAVLAAIAGDT